MPLWLTRRAPLLLFLALYALTAALTFRQFGTTWDEGDVYVRGARLLHALTSGDPGRLVEKHEDPDGNEVYNHTYAMLLNAVNPATDLDTFHGWNLAVASLGYVASYEIVLSATGGPWAALLGPVCLLLNPRFSGDTPANPKDMPFAVFSLCFLALLARVPERRLALKLSLLALALFLACTQRLAGFSLLLPAALWWFALAPDDERPSRARATLRLAFLAVAALALLYATWPYLRLALWAHLKEVAALSLNFPYNGNVLFDGRLFKVHDLPAAYPWVWLSIAVPTLILIASALAFPFALRRSAPPALRLVAWALLLDLLLLLVARPALYDGMRHLLYLLPLLSILAAWAVWKTGSLLPQGPPRAAFAFSIALYGASVLFRMVSLHPYEYLYFNARSGGLKGAEGRFETDYWGAAYREAALWLREHEGARLQKPFNLHTKGNALQTIAYLTDLPIHWTTLGDADYFIASTRWDEYREAGDRPPLHVVERDGVPLCYVYRMK